MHVHVVHVHIHMYMYIVCLTGMYDVPVRIIGFHKCSQSWSMCNHCFCRKLAHGSSVDDQGRDTDASFAVRGAEEEVYVPTMYMYVPNVHVHVYLHCMYMSCVHFKSH